MINAEHNWLRHAEALILVGGAFLGIIAFAIRNALRVAKLEWQVDQLWQAHQEENGKIEALWSAHRKHLTGAHGEDDAAGTST